MLLKGVEEFISYKISHSVLNPFEACKNSLGSTTLDMAKIFHGRSNLALVKIKNVFSSQIFLGATKRSNHFASRVDNRSDVRISL